MILLGIAFSLCATIGVPLLFAGIFVDLPLLVGGAELTLAAYLFAKSIRKTLFFLQQLKAIASAIQDEDTATVFRLSDELMRIFDLSYSQVLEFAEQVA